MVTTFPDDDWFPEDESLFDGMTTDEAEFVRDSLQDYVNIVGDGPLADELEELIAEFGEFLNSTPDGVPPYEEG